MEENQLEKKEKRVKRTKYNQNMILVAIMVVVYFEPFIH